jgi:Zn-dependent protease with chaperone function/competence protein ComGC
MRAQELRSGSEKTLYKLCAFVSFVVWAVVVMTIMGLLYGLLVGFFLFVAHALFIAHIKGNGVKLSETQLPAIYRKVVEATQKLGLDKAPEAYVMQAGGMLNAFATKFVGRNFIVVYSDLLEACGEDTREMDMIIGHEVGHLALGHLKFIWFLFPAHLIPWLWPAYSRQREYSCDRCGYEVAGDFGSAARGLAVLAAGGKYGKQVDLDAFTKQIDDTKGFWTSVYELNASHPYLPKRIAALVNLKSPGAIPLPGRHPLAYPLSPIFAIGSPAGAGPMIMIAVIAILAAIAIPQYNTFRERAEQAVMDSSLKEMHIAATQYEVRTGAWPCSMEDLQLQQLASTASVKKWRLVVNCKEQLAAVVYDGADKKQRYRAIHFKSGQIEAGNLNE